MKTKIYKIFGVALALVLVFGLIGAFIPVDQAEAQAPGTTPNQWQSVDLPGLAVEKLRADSDILDIAVAGDGATIYAITGSATSFETWTGGGVGGWSSTPTETEGSYCASLSGPMIVRVPYGETFADLAVVASAQVQGFDVWDIKWRTYDTTALNLHAKIYLDTDLDADGLVDTVLTGGFGASGTAPRAVGSWEDEYMRSDSTWIIDGYDDGEFSDAAVVGGRTYNAGDDNYQLSEYLGHDALWPDAIVVYIAYGYSSGTEAYVDDITVGGTTILSVEPGDTVLKSDSNGWMWDVLPAPSAAATPRYIAVSPDDPSALAIVDSSTGQGTDVAGTVWISNNGGTTWAALTAVPGNNAGTSVVTDIAVGPTRAGTILSRDYVVTVADTVEDQVDGGDVLYQGLNTAWVSCANDTAFADNTYDFTSVAVSPGFLGDRTFVAVGSSIVGKEGLDTFLLMIRTSDTADPVLISPPGAQSLNTSTADSPGDYDAAGATGHIVASSIALPSDFDPTQVPTGMRAWVGYTSGGGPAVDDDDVYRVDFQTTRKLETGAANGIHSVAYSGTISSGTLIAGEATVTAVVYTTVWYTADPNVSQPSWSSSSKSPTGTNNCVVGMDPADPTLCYAGTGGAHSAFSSSRNGGVSFNQIGLVDAAITVLEDVMPSPDGSVIFLATTDGTNASLWKCTTPPSGPGYERVRVRPGATGYIIRLSPEYGDAPALYYCDVGTDGRDIQKSTSGGDIFSTRTAPEDIADIAVESAEILYMASGVNSYKSTNGAWFFDLPVNTGAVGYIVDLEMAPSYPAKPIPGYLLAGSAFNGLIVRSPSAGDFWIPLTPVIPGGTSLQVVADEDFANNNTVYAGDGNAGGGIWRYEIGTSTTWENIQTIANDTVITGIAMRSGALYGSWYDDTPDASGALRTLVPDIPVIASWIWDDMDAGATTAIFGRTPNALRAAGGSSSIGLWAIDTVVPALMAYDDTMAAAKVELNVPEEVGFDSVTGRNTQFTISWSAISNATDYEVEIHNDPACSQMVITSLPYGPVVTDGPPPWYVPSNPLSPTLVVGADTLVAGQDYFVRARIRDQTPNDAVRSPYSSVYRFSVKGGEMVQVTYLGVQPLGPVPAAINVPLSPGFTWSPYASSTRYEFQLATDPGFADILAESKTSGTGYKYDGNLSPATTYFWRARGIEPTTTDWSPVSSFTTEKKAEPPIVVEPAPTPPAPAPSVVTPSIIWAIIAIGAILVIAVIVLIVKTRAAR